MQILAWSRPPFRAASLMGNQLDRITHLNYSELPTGDPSGIEQDELRVGVAYFFSDEEEVDLDERGGGGGVGVPPEATKYSGGRGAGSPAPETPIHHHHHHFHHLHDPGTPPPPLLLSEPQFRAFRGPECIFSKGSGGALGVYPAAALPALCQAGDLLELLDLGGTDPPAWPPRWAVYVGGGQVVQLRGGQIRQEGLREAGGGLAGRVVSDWYRFRPLVAELVVQNARGHLGLKSPEICWTNSESFAAWCRFGKREFKAGGEGASGAGDPRQQYYLQSRLADGEAHTARFHSLEELIREKRRLDASARLRALKGLAIGDGKE
ncbi:protein LRATD1 isoform X1 [Anolis carolinensis]|uniref:protein LRATD1 isoform X1 n=1 Tax=Anolis carolinensis TaxID=28377 RepID=UPI002F2B518D